MAASTDDIDRRWTQLMRDAQSGDKRAYESLLREIVPFVRAITLRRCGGRCDVDEIVQETLLTLHRVRHTYDPRRAFKPWVAAIAERRGIDALRKASRIAKHEMSDPGDAYETFPDAAAKNELEAIGAEGELSGLLERLPPRQRQALEATKLHEMSLIEASAASGQSVGALKVNTHRALRSLRASFQKRQQS